MHSLVCDKRLAGFDAWAEPLARPGKAPGPLRSTKRVEVDESRDHFAARSADAHDGHEQWGVAQHFAP